MKSFLLHLSLLVLANTVVAQTQFNNFESSQDLEIQIDSLSADSIWQIGSPQKMILNQAASPPNVLISDTINPYPINADATFSMELNENTSLYFPFVQLEWFQKTDFEDGVDGGVIEASYDEGQTWTNVLDDPVYRPEIVGTFQWDTLHNGQAGLTGTTELAWMAICWGSSMGTGTIPYGFSTVQVRFTLVSDSIDTQQEGWLLDDFTVQTGVIGNTSDQPKYESFPVRPNPAKEEIFIDLSQIDRSQVSIQLFDNLGKVVYANPTFLTNERNNRISVTEFSPGIYYIIVKTEEAIFQQKFIKVD